MTDKLNPRRVANTLAIVAGVVYAVCAILVAIFPTGTVNVFGNLFHGIDISKIARVPTLGGTIIGLIEIFILGWIIGWFFAIVYNKLK